MGMLAEENFIIGEKKLPLKDFTGQILSYKEWDIHPKSSHSNRGAERIITDSNLNAYYTKDHYKTFIKIKI
jgi:ribonuclease T1